MKSVFDSDTIEPNPNPKDREPTWAFLTADGIATAWKGDHGVAPERRAGQGRDPHCTSPSGHGNRAPPCGPSTATCSASGEHARRREGAGRSPSSSLSATEDGCAADDSLSCAAR